jgi:ParB family chromosome partitioning protein
MSALIQNAGKLGDSLADFLAGSNEVPEIHVHLDDIAVRKQVREEFEDPDDEDSIQNLGKSLRKRQLQAIILRPDPRGEKPYELVCGERRVRGARTEGLPTLRAVVFELTDEEAADAQMVENIHRKNLSQLEEAKRLKRDFDELKSQEAVAHKHNKSVSWVSKRLALLDLGPQAKRLVAENISADKDVIGKVRQVERKSPEKAKQLVDDLKARGPKGNARGIAEEVRKDVKPVVRKTPAKPAPREEDDDAIATPRDLSHQAPGTVSVFPAPPVKPQAKLLRDACDALARGVQPEAVFSALPPEKLDDIEKLLRPIHKKGLECKLLVSGLIAGMKDGTFGPDGERAIAMAAFVQGHAQWPQVNLLEAFKAVQSA